jgi:hypothetical protein
VLRTRPPLSTPPKSRAPSDLHVLRTPPAFVLSQDQTRHPVYCPTDSTRTTCTHVMRPQPAQVLDCQPPRPPAAPTTLPTGGSVPSTPRAREDSKVTGEPVAIAPPAHTLLRTRARVHALSARCLRCSCFSLFSCSGSDAYRGPLGRLAFRPFFRAPPDNNMRSRRCQEAIWLCRRARSHQLLAPAKTAPA